MYLAPCLLTIFILVHVETCALFHAASFSMEASYHPLLYYVVSLIVKQLYMNDSTTDLLIFKIIK